MVWAGLLGLSVTAGLVLRGTGSLRLDHLPPLYAHPRLPGPGMLPVAALGLALWALLSRMPTGPRLRLLGSPAAAWALAAVWAVALAASDGWDAVTAPVRLPTEYLAGLPAVGDDPVRWLHGFTRALPGYPTHVQGHPPLPVLVLWGLRSLGLGGAGWAAAVIIAAGSSSAAAIMLTVRRLAGLDAARRAMPFLVLAPYAVWIATSMDALFLGAGAWGAALLALACPPAPDPDVIQDLNQDEVLDQHRHERRPHLAWSRMGAALAGGVLLGALPYLSYGLLPLLAVPLAVVLVRRPPAPVLAAVAAGLAVVPVAFTAAGFWWFDGLAATHAAWAAGAGAHRPYGYFLVANLAVLGVLTGPATAAALGSVVRGKAALRALPTVIRRSAAPLAAAALAGVAALDLAGVTRGEVERIWLPYAAWVLTAVSVRGRYPEPGHERRPGSGRAPGSGDAPGYGHDESGPIDLGGRGWLLAQVITALILQGLVRSPW